MAAIRAIDKTQHRQLKVRDNKHFAHSRNHHIVPLVVHEFAPAALEYPIVFVKDSQTGRFKAVALLGLQPNENLFFRDSMWCGSYVPQSLKTYPFFLAPHASDEDKATLCIDESSELVNDSDGHPLFDDSGEQTEFTSAVCDFLVDFKNKTQITETFIDTLLDKSLLTPRKLTLKKLPGKGEYDITGLYTIAEDKLNALPDEEFLELKHKGMLAPIFAALFSQRRIHYLVDLTYRQQP